MSKRLSQVQVDLHRYAQGKVYNAMKDILQAFRFGQEGVDRLLADLCPMCGSDSKRFTDEPSRA